MSGINIILSKRKKSINKNEYQRDWHKYKIQVVY